MSRIRRLERIEGLLSQQARLAEAEGLQELAESARAKQLDFLAMARAGVPIAPSAVQHDGPHHEALRQRLSTMSERLMRFADIRERVP
jgi:hypothetical protein